MLKTLSNLRKQDKEKYKAPRRVQDVIPIRRVWEDGIFQVGSQYLTAIAQNDRKVLFIHPFIDHPTHKRRQQQLTDGRHRHKYRRPQNLRPKGQQMSKNTFHTAHPLYHIPEI